MLRVSNRSPPSHHAFFSFSTSDEMIKISGQKLPSKLVAYPSYGYRADDGFWRINISGVAFQTPPFTLRQRMMIRMLRNVMNVSEAELKCENFENRIWPFMAEADKGLDVHVKIGDTTRRLRRRTGRNGHFAGWPRFSDELIRENVEQDKNGRLLLKYHVTTSISDSNGAEGISRLIPSQGLSVVSDIDDTIKDSSVVDKRQLLRNTFLHDFKTIEGMAPLYQRWFSAGAEFHYVSSSPWQLFNALKRLQTDGGFPDGTIHLRNFRLRDQLLKKLPIVRRKGKAMPIITMLKQFPNRKFVLVGDSGEKDPEIYRKICRRYSKQIVGLFIREVAERPMPQERTRKLIRVVKNGICDVFSDSMDLESQASDIFAD